MSKQYLLNAFLVLTMSSGGLFAQTYKVNGAIKIGGTGGWDYLAADAANRRLYVSHDTEVDIVDLDSGKPVGKIGDMRHIHGIAAAATSIVALSATAAAMKLFCST